MSNLVHHYVGKITVATDGDLGLVALMPHMTPATEKQRAICTMMSLYYYNQNHFRFSFYI